MISNAQEINIPLHLLKALEQLFLIDKEILGDIDSQRRYSNMINEVKDQKNNILI
jgi:hypothetical protein